MNLKELGLRFALGYLFSRASGRSQGDAAVDSLVGSTIAQAQEDVTGFTPEIAEVTSLMANDLVLARRARDAQSIDPNVVVNPDPNEVAMVTTQVTDPSIGVTSTQVVDEVSEIVDGFSEAVSIVTRLERLQAGILRRD